MNFLIISNDKATYCPLAEIIENNGLGKIIQSNHLLDYEKADILIMELAKPANRSLERLHKLTNLFSGEIIIVSQIRDKEVIAKSYSLGIEYYIVKPIYSSEIIEILKKVIKLTQFKKCLRNAKNIFKNLKF
ncbi:response regulator [Clostridium sp. AWRP]|uniref:response regulator n=1 Tax=Clostridium sp. AWRP TaxID=2212991 RepID=UPI000FD8971F|nr:response regulator [Clostridium sp. AWRP]AZV58913.1 response regulator [Clostridium sp. AWRP]